MFALKPLHAYIYGRWTGTYIKFLINQVQPRLGPKGKKWLSDRYHAKIITTEQASTIININKDIPLKDLEQVIPYPLARDLMLEGPPDIAAYECSCRYARENSCQPTQVCLVVGKYFVDFIVEYHPKKARRITRDEALEILRQENERGHLHSAWFKDVALNRFYSICNCCKCCCGGIEAMVKYKNPMMVSSGYVSKINLSLCNSCGICAELCPFMAISIPSGTALVDKEKCMGCGICRNKCPEKAVMLYRDMQKPEPLDIDEIVKQV